MLLLKRGPRYEWIKQISLVALIVLSAAMALRDLLPADKGEISRLTQRARQSERAIFILKAGLDETPDPNKGQLRTIARRVDVELARSYAEMRGDVTQAHRDMQAERERLALLSFWTMSMEDRARFLLLWLESKREIKRT